MPTRTRNSPKRQRELLARLLRRTPNLEKSFARWAQRRLNETSRNGEKRWERGDTPRQSIQMSTKVLNSPKSNQSLRVLSSLSLSLRKSQNKRATKSAAGPKQCTHRSIQRLRLMKRTSRMSRSPSPQWFQSTSSFAKKTRMLKQTAKSKKCCGSTGRKLKN